MCVCVCVFVLKREKEHERDKQDVCLYVLVFVRVCASKLFVSVKMCVYVAVCR